MLISIVIPAFNEEKLIGATLQAVRGAAAAFDQMGWQWEIVVCDNNSTDKTAAMAREAGAKVVFEPVNQIAKARNSGAAGAAGDWLIFVDADSRPSAELFADVGRAIASGKVLGGGSFVKMDHPGLVPAGVAAFWNNVSRVTRWAAGAFIFCETAAFREFGGFNEKLFASEEIDLSKKLKKAARRRRLSVVILRRHPLLTSARKLHLYSGKEILRFLAIAAAKPGRTLGSREACHYWYDGRR